jgi:hypothetical protein
VSHFHEVRHLAAARPAPRRPEVQQNDVSLFVFELKCAVVQLFDLGGRQRDRDRRVFAVRFFNRFV